MINTLLNIFISLFNTSFVGFFYTLLALGFLFFFFRK